MPKRKRVKTRTRTVVKRVGSKGVNFMNRPTVKGFLYGLVREPVNTATRNIFSSVPGLNALGGVGDEVLLWLASTAGSNFSRGQMKELFKTAQSIEAHNVGRQMNLGGLGSVFSTQSSNASTGTSGDGW